MCGIGLRIGPQTELDQVQLAADPEHVEIDRRTNRAEGALGPSGLDVRGNTWSRPFLGGRAEELDGAPRA